MISLDQSVAEEENKNMKLLGQMTQWVLNKKLKYFVFDDSLVLFVDKQRKKREMDHCHINCYKQS